MGERLNGIQEVAGSIPVSSTILLRLTAKCKTWVAASEDKSAFNLEKLLHAKEDALRSRAKALGDGGAKEGRLKYVYLLRSLSDPSKIYTGLTDDLARRLDDHNSGKSPFSSRHVPWKIQVSLAFENDDRAAQFERYLKTGSGIAFARKHLW